MGKMRYKRFRFFKAKQRADKFMKKYEDTKGPFLCGQREDDKGKKYNDYLVSWVE